MSINKRILETSSIKKIQRIKEKERKNKLNKNSKHFVMTFPITKI
jgi:hypothetical protein